MELGLTFPLRRFPKMKTPAYGTQPDRHFFWISLPERHKKRHRMVRCRFDSV